jgi:hypothetical protein
MSKAEKNLAGKEEAKRIPKKYPEDSRHSGKTPQEIMSRHIRDKHDVITDEDFKNLNIGIDVTDETDQPPLDIPNDPGRPKDEDKDPEIITSWNLIDT